MIAPAFTPTWTLAKVQRMQNNSFFFFSFALAGLPFQFEVQTTDMRSLNFIPCIGIHIKRISNT